MRETAKAEQKRRRGQGETRYCTLFLSFRNPVVLHRSALTVCNVNAAYTDSRKVSANPEKGNSRHGISAVSSPVKSLSPRVYQHAGT